MSDRRPFGPADFEALWRTDPDPWDFAGSPYERAKHARTVEVCGTAGRGRVLELGAANGVLSVALAERAASLETLEYASTAVALARERLAAAGHGDVLVRRGLVPEDLPEPPAAYDAIVASEILYYLERPVLDATIDRLVALLAPGGRIVAVHWTPDAPDHVLPGRVPHEALRARPDLTVLESAVAETYLLDVLGRAS